MPPNRKTDLSAEDLPTLDANTLLLRKNLVPSDTAPQVTAAAPKTPSCVDDYWAWAIDPTVASLQEAETARRLTSANHVQQNLVEAAALAQSPRTTVRASFIESSQDEYWDMPSTAPKSNEVPQVLYQHLQKAQQTTSSTTTSSSHPPLEYWDWPAGSSKVEHDEQCLHRVLDAARARHLTSAAVYEQQLLRGRDSKEAAVVAEGGTTNVTAIPTRCARATTTSSSSSTEQGYWDF